MEKVELLKKGASLLKNLTQRMSSPKTQPQTSFQSTLEDSVSRTRERSDNTEGVLSRWFTKDPIRERQMEIQRTRNDLEEFNVTIADLNRKIERMEKITAKWKERGESFDSRV